MPYISIAFYDSSMQRRIVDGVCGARAPSGRVAQLAQKRMPDDSVCVRVDFDREDADFVVTMLLPGLGPLVTDDNPFLLGRTTHGAAAVIRARMEMETARDPPSQEDGKWQMGKHGFTLLPEARFGMHQVTYYCERLTVFALQDGHPAAPKQAGKIGRGVKATDLIRKLHIICMYDEFGVLATHKEVDAAPKHFLEYKANIDDDLCVLGNPCGKCPGPLINSYKNVASAPNCGLMPITRGAEVRMAVMSLCEIQPGSELLLDYGDKFGL